MLAYPSLVVNITGTAHYRCFDNVNFPVQVEATLRPQYNNCSFASPIAFVDPYWIEAMGGDPELYTDDHKHLQFITGFSAEFLTEEDEERYNRFKKAKDERDLKLLEGD